MAGSCDGDRIGVNHAEALLVNGVLGLGRGDLLLTVVSDAKTLKLLVDEEAGPEKLSVSYEIKSEAYFEW